MKKTMLFSIFFSLIFLLFVQVAEARIRVRGYTRKNGTYVMPHFRSNPNRTRFDNWSTKGSINPYTGKRGYKSVYK